MNGATQDATILEEVADALYEAHKRAKPIAPVREALGAHELDAAYEVQELVVSRRVAAGAVRVGRKVGLTNVRVQQQLGVDQPDFGVLLDDMDASALDVIDTSGLVSPRIEAEIAFIMAENVDRADRDGVMGAVGAAVAAFEIVDSRVRDWDISIVDTIADNASSARYVLGSRKLPLAQLDTAGVVMTMSVDGEEVSRGTGAACLGDPINALLWVAETAERIGRPLRAGEVVLSGALGPMVPFVAGRKYEASITGLGEVTAVAGKGTECTSRK